MVTKRIYETMFIVSPKLSEEARNEMAEKVKTYIEERVGGTIEKFDRWGMRRLAYRVQKGFTEGDYTVVLFRAEPENLTILERLFNITPEVFRWQTFRREDLEKEEKKALLKKASTEETPDSEEAPVVEDTPEVLSEAPETAEAGE